jgi:hypothetical protein
MIRTFLPLLTALALVLALTGLPTQAQIPGFPQNAVQGATLQNAATATANGSTFVTSLGHVVSFQVSGTFVGTVTFEGSNDATNWTSLSCLSLDATTVTSTATAPGFTRCNVNAIPSVRARISAYTSGSITVTANLSTGPLMRLQTGRSGVAFAPSLTPAATAAAIGTTQQTFTLTGLLTTDVIYVDGPVPTSLCPMTNYRVSAGNTLQLDFTTLTAVACTPAAGVYNLVVLR